MRGVRPALMCGGAWLIAGCSCHWSRDSSSPTQPLFPMERAARAQGLRGLAALTVLAAMAGVAGGTQAGSRGGVTAGVVRTLRTDLLAAQTPAAVRAGWSMGRERGHTASASPRRTREGSVFISVLHAKHRLFFGKPWLPARTTLLRELCRQWVSPGQICSGLTPAVSV